MKSIAVLLSLVAIGCASEPPAAPVQPVAKAQEPKETAPEPAPIQTNPNDNPSRLHQLRDLKRVKLKVGAREIPAWVMDDDGKRAEGMMFLTAKDVKDTEGMIFVFPDAQPRSFWMQNTLLALDIVYIDPAGKVVKVVKGKPQDETPLPSDAPAQFVLELKQGGAQKFGITKGTKITLPKDLRANA